MNTPSNINLGMIPILQPVIPSPGQVRVFGIESILDARPVQGLVSRVLGQEQTRGDPVRVGLLGPDHDDSFPVTFFFLMRQLRTVISSCMKKQDQDILSVSKHLIGIRPVLLVKKVVRYPDLCRRAPVIGIVNRERGTAVGDADAGLTTVASYVWVVAERSRRRLGSLAGGCVCRVAGGSIHCLSKKEHGSCGVGEIHAACVEERFHCCAGDWRDGPNAGNEEEAAGACEETFDSWHFWRRGDEELWMARL